MNPIPECLTGAPNLLLSRVLFRHGCRTGELSGGLINDPDRAVTEYLQVLTNLGDFDRNHWKTLVGEIQKDLGRRAAGSVDIEALADEPSIIVSGKLVGVNPIRIQQTYKEFPSNIEIRTTTTIGAILGHISAAGADAAGVTLETACRELTAEMAAAYLGGAEFKRKAGDSIKNLSVEAPAVIRSAEPSGNAAEATKLVVESPVQTLARPENQGISLQRIQTRLQYMKEFL
jgi:hypothetical protein